jgi:hypothetical protein
MALSKIIAEGVDLTDTFAFTGTVTGAGEITASTTAPSEGGAVTTNVVQGLTKAWVNWKGDGIVAIRDSINVSSIDDNSTGQYDVNYSNLFAIAGYCPTTAGAGGSGFSGVYDFTFQTTAYVNIRYYAGGYYDMNTCNTQINGELV